MTIDVVAITGVSGYIGSRLAQHLTRCSTVELRGLHRTGEPPHVAGGGRSIMVRGDLADPAALGRLLKPGCAVVNCVYDPGATRAENVAAARQLADACLTHKVRRLIHCSTASVVGRTGEARIDETTRGTPRSEYETTKLEIENVLCARAREGFELVILRPTAVFGAGSRNLLKLAGDITHGARFANYLRSCANDRRRMNLVTVDTVIAAIVFLLGAPGPFHNEVFIVSEDDVPANNFRDVERALMRELGNPDYALPRVALPAAALSLLLRLRGRTLTNPESVFSCDKLRRAGFCPPASFESSLSAFARSYASAHASTGSCLA